MLLGNLFVFDPYPLQLQQVILGIISLHFQIEDIILWISCIGFKYFSNNSNTVRHMDSTWS